MERGNHAIPGATTDKTLRALRECLDSITTDPDGTPEIIAPCIMAGGVPIDGVPTDLNTRGKVLHVNGDARLALHALATIDNQATHQWKDYQVYPDDVQSMPDVWCEMVARLMTVQEFKEWVTAAGKHLNQGACLTRPHMDLP